MIFRRSLTRELINSAGAVFVALFTIYLTVMLTRLLGQAVNGRIASEGVFSLFAFTLLGALPLLLPPTLFVATLLVLTRWYRDHEMVIWLSSGYSLFSFVRPVMRVAIPMALLVALCSFVISPWASKQSTELRQRFERRSDLARVTPGQFNESSGAQRVFFVESINEGDTRRVRNVFVTQQTHTPRGEQQSIAFSRSGVIGERLNNDYFLVLEEGFRYDNQPGTPGEFDVMGFQRYAVAMDAKPDLSPFSYATNAIPTGLLMRNLHQSDKSASLAGQGELLRRIAWPLVVLNLGLLAIPLSYTGMRAGRSMNMLFALLLFVFYSNLVSFVQAQVSRDRLSLGIGWWALHAAIFLIVLIMFYWRHNGRHRVGMWLGHWRSKFLMRQRLLSQTPHSRREA